MPAKLSHVCLFTDDVQALTKFYEYVLDMPADSNLGSYVQFKTEGSAIIAIWDIAEQNAKAPGSAEAHRIWCPMGQRANDTTMGNTFCLF